MSLHVVYFFLDILIVFSEYHLWNILFRLFKKIYKGDYCILVNVDVFINHYKRISSCFLWQFKHTQHERVEIKSAYISMDMAIISIIK